jgi:phage/plasmid-associated DNA primase
MTNATDFIAFCEKHKFIGFSFEKITTYLNTKGEEKKKLKGLEKGWSEKITTENWKEFVKETDTAFAIITGHKSGLSVIDFDDNDGYYRFLLENGYSGTADIYYNDQTLTISTKKGFHLYYKYDPDIKQTQNKKASIDARNDGGLIIAPFTTYKMLDGSIAKYNINQDYALTELFSGAKNWLGERDLINNYEKKVEEKKEEKVEKKSKSTKKKSKPILIMEDDDENTTISTNTEKEEKPKKNSFTFLKESKQPDLADEINYYIKNGMFKEITNCNDPYGTWLRIGASLKSEFEKDIALSLFKDISQLYPDYWDEKGCEEKFEKIKCDKITIGSLFYYLKQENEKGYKKLKREYKCDNIDILNSGFSTGVIADYFVSLYKDEFIYSNEVLYYWNGIYWKPDDKGCSYLSKFIDKIFVKDLTNYYITKYKEWNDYRAANEVAEAEAEMMDKLLSSFNNNINFKLRNHHYRGSYLKDILNFVCNNDMKWNDRPTLFVFENAVVDLVTGEKITPNPDDYLTISCGYEWTPKDEAKIKVLNDILNVIFPDQEVKLHYLEILATGLCGYQQEKFFVATGKGGNGKGVLNDLMMVTAGNYAYKLPSDFVCNPMKEGPNPMVANMDGKRFVKMEEPPPNRRIKCAVMKEITGGKNLNARKLHSNDCRVILVLTLVMECNDMLKYDEVGDAVARRSDITPFVAKAVSQQEYDATPEEDRMNLIIANPDYKTNAFQQEYKMSLFYILLDEFKKFASRKFTLSPQPKAVLDKNKAQMASSDDFYNWFDKEFIKDDNAEAIKLKDIYISFEISTFYSTLSKHDKRTYNQKYFIEKMEDNTFIKKHILKTGKYYQKDANSKKVRLTSPILIGHSYRKDCKVVEEEDEIIEEEDF